MTVETILSSTSTILPLEDLIEVAGHARNGGEDLRAAFVTQAQLRQRAASAILEGVNGDRADLLASETRAYDKYQREIPTILDLADRIASRSRYAPPASVSDPGGDAPARADVPAVLRRGDSLVELQRRHSPTEQAPDFGRVVRSWLTKDTSGCTTADRRALSEGVGADGGFLITPALSAQLFDRMRDDDFFAALGVGFVPMSSNVVHIARIGQPNSVSPSIDGPEWKQENAPIQEGGVTLERVTFTARTQAWIWWMSEEVSQDAINLDSVINTEMPKRMASALQATALYGSGIDPEPRGILNQSGVHIESFGGGAPTNYDLMLDAIGRLWAKNVSPNGVVMNPALEIGLSKLKSSADDQPLRMPELAAALTRRRTNLVTNSNASPNTGTMITADWSQLLIGVRTSFRLEMTRTGGDAFSRLQVGIRCYMRADVQLAHPEAFDVLSDVGI